MALSHAAKGHTLAACGALLVGFFPIIFRELVFAVESIVFASFLLLSVAWVMSLPFALTRIARGVHHPHKNPHKNYVMLVCLMALMVITGVLGNVLAAWSLEEIMPATMQFLQRVEVIAVVVLGAFLFQEKITLRLVSAIAIALLGVFFIYRTDFAYPHWYSLLLPVSSGIMFAVLNVAFKKVSTFSSPMLLNSVRLFFTSLVLAVISYSAWHPDRITWFVLLLALLAAIAGPIGARTLYTYSFRYITLGHSILFTTVSPFATLLIQWAAFGLVPDGFELLGGTIIMFAIVCAIAPNMRKTPLVTDI